MLASLPDAVDKVAASTVGVAMRRHAASGVVWEPGIVVTSASAVWRASRLQLVLPGGEPLEGSLRGLDGATDLAAIAFEGAAVLTADRPSGDVPPPRAGDFVFAVAVAVGRQPSGLVEASFGHVGTAAGEWRSWRGGRIDRLIRLDGGLYPGLAGAPVADAAGRVNGVGSPAFSRTHGVVLPGTTIDHVLAHGRVRRGYAGIAAQPVLDGSPVEGLYVSSVDADGPATATGVLVGDVIVEAGGRPLTSVEALRDGLSSVQAGEKLSLKIARGGQPVTLDLDGAEPPQERRSGRHGRRCG